MYKIVVKDGKEEKALENTDKSERRFGSLAEAVLAAQGLGLTRLDVELYFVKCKSKPEQEEEPKQEDDHLTKMTKAELIAYAKKKNVEVSETGTVKQIIDSIKATGK